MTRPLVPSQLLKGGTGLPDTLPAIIRGLAGIQFSIVAGAAAGSLNAVAAMRDTDYIANVLVPPTIVTPAVAESDSVAVSATGGVWNVIWGGVTSEALAWDISAANLKLAMERMASVGVGFITSITGGPGDVNGSAPYVITWNASLGNASNLTTVATSLTGTKTAVVTPSQGTTQVSGTWLDVASTCTPQSCKASGTLTLTDVPHNSTNFVVNGVTYTFKTTLADCLDGTYIYLQNGITFAQVCDKIAATVNSYESRYVGGLGWHHNSGYNDPAVYATSNNVNIVTFTSLREGAGNGPVVVGTVAVLAETTTDPAAPYVTASTVIEDNTITVNGVTFTAKDAPATALQFDVKLTDIAQADEIARCLNAYAVANDLDFVASTTGTAVVTIKPRAARYGNIITMTAGTATHTTAAGSGRLTGGTATGGFKSTTDLSGKSVLVFWSDLN